MIQMNFTKEEIRTSLLNNRYDEVMATYLLLDEKRANLSVSSGFFSWTFQFYEIDKLLNIKHAENFNGFSNSSPFSHPRKRKLLSGNINCFPES
jgi:hypothetical protein